MKITKPLRVGDYVSVDLVKPSKLSPEGWVAAIGLEVVGTPRTFYVQVPYGQYGVRVMTTAAVEVKVEVDGAKVIESSLTKGFHILDKTSDGRQLTFVSAEDAEAGQPLLFDKESLGIAPGHGLVAVSVRFADIITNGVMDVPPDFPESVHFQMNPPDLHLKEVAARLSQVVAPPKIPFADEVTGEGEHALPGRFCSVCGQTH